MRRIQNPFIFAVLISAIVAIGVYAKISIKPIMENLVEVDIRAKLISDILVNLITFAGMYWAICRLGLQSIAGFSKTPLRNKKLLLVPLILILLVAKKIFQTDLSQIVWIDMFLLAVWVLSVGLFEEIAFRGLLQANFLRYYKEKKNGVIKSVVWSSVIFGLLHLLNITNGWIGEISQVGVATIFGMIFGALVIRTGRLYPFVIFHAVFDFFPSLDIITNQNVILRDHTLSEEFTVILVMLPFLAFGIYQLLKIQKSERVNLCEDNNS